MSAPRWLILLTGLVFLVYGLGFIVAPAFWAQLMVDAVPGSSQAMTDMRATYGGLSVAVGVMLLLLFRSDVRLGLVAMLAAMLLPFVTSRKAE